MQAGRFPIYQNLTEQRYCRCCMPFKTVNCVPACFLNMIINITLPIPENIFCNTTISLPKKSTTIDAPKRRLASNLNLGLYNHLGSGYEFRKRKLVILPMLCNKTNPRKFQQLLLTNKTKIFLAAGGLLI